MGDWRAMGQGARRRMGRPSSYNAGTRVPSQIPRIIDYGDEREAGRPIGTEKDHSLWDEAVRKEKAFKEDEWTRQLREQSQNRHPSMQQKRMRPSDQYFG